MGYIYKYIGRGLPIPHPLVVPYSTVPGTHAAHPVGTVWEDVSCRREILKYSAKVIIYIYHTMIPPNLTDI